MFAIGPVLLNALCNLSDKKKTTLISFFFILTHPLQNWYTRIQIRIMKNPLLSITVHQDVAKNPNSFFNSENHYTLISDEIIDTTLLGRSSRL